MAYLTAEKKQELFGKYGKSNTDTGSPESQIALFSYRISHLTEHLKSNKHDFGTQRALLRLVGKRRKLLMQRRRCYCLCQNCVRRTFGQDYNYTRQF